MKRLSLASVVLLWGLTGCARANRMDGQSGAGSSTAELLLLLFVGVVLYLVLSRLVASLWHRTSRTEDYSFDLASRRVWVRRRRSHRRRRPGPDSGTDRSASAIDSVSRPSAQHGASGESG